MAYENSSNGNDSKASDKHERQLDADRAAENREQANEGDSTTDPDQLKQAS